ncbi:hypothetical protein GCM10011492_34120 [Flexivirga endophytica]|uniref:DUF1905 domain-containing protein n=1 Tax=Flexivirga endophytica TaxID=1849103 RepID=A0A916TCU7_9MICO|nr:DUF1905 domain-containing protein [Flexivirga endophytica]GGB40484.1 hypothetical protein GCM10011492_34120 [Flexivirga endophytica]GHB48313.1 hypothetical protein GCM10008112_16510 [Flexivirga endophytica]
MELEFDAEIIEWRGPAPYLFAPLPPEQADDLAQVARELTYGWGCIPARGRIGGTEFTTSIFPRAGGYLVPVKTAVQRAEGVGLGDVIHLEIQLEPTVGRSDQDR